MTQTYFPPDTTTLVVGSKAGRKRRHRRNAAEAYGFLAPTLILHRRSS